MLALSVGHPWAPPAVGLKNGWRMAYQVPLAAPVIGERVVRDGRFPRAMLIKGRADGRRWTDEELETYLDPAARAGDRPRLVAALPRVPHARAGRPAPTSTTRFAAPATLLIGDKEPFRAFAEGFRGEVEVVDGAGHFLPEEAPEAVAERIRAM